MRTPRFVILTLVTCAAIGTSVAHASDAPILKTGTFEFTPSLAFNRSSFDPIGTAANQSVTHLSFDASISRCMSDRFELGASFLAQHRAIGGDGRDAFGGAVTGTINFPPQGNVIPFASAGAGALAFTSEGRTDQALLLPMLRVGFRTMISEARSLNISVGFQHETNSKSAIEESANTFEVGVGLSFFRPSTH